MLVGVILIISLLFQGVAIFLAVRLIRITGWRTPWLLIAGAVLLMAVRRGITSYQLFLGDLPTPPDPAAEAVALVISILMVAGLSRIAPSFRSAQSAETRLQEHQHFLQQILDTEPGTVYIYDLVERRNVFINRHWLRAYGYSAEETQSMESDLLARIFHPDDLARIAAHHDTWRRAGDQDIREIEYRVRTKGGEWRWLHSREALFARDDSGQVKQVLGVAHDITERKQIGATLSEREALLRTIVDTEPECVKLVGPEGSLLSMNPAGLAMIEADSLDQVKGRSIYPLVAKEHRPAFRALTERVFRGESGTLEFSVQGLKGRSRWLETHAVPLRNSSGEIMALLGVTRDITERKQAEEALRESQRTLSTLISNLPGVVYRCRNDKDWSTEFVSEGMLALTGYAPSAFSDGTIAFGQLIHRDDQERVWNDIQTALQERRPYQLVYRIHTAAGEEKWVWEQGTGIFAQSGELLFLEGFITDITERRRAEETLRSSEARLTALMQSVDGIVWEADAQTFRFTFVSQRAERLLGHPLVRWTEEPTFWADHLHPDDREGTVRYCLRCVLEKRDHQFEYRMLAADGRTVWLRDIVTVAVENDRPAKLRGIMVDITERKRGEIALRDSEERYRRLVNDLPGTVYRCKNDPDWTTEFVSEGCLALTGYAPHDIENNSTVSLGALIHPDDRERVWEKCQRNLDAKRVCRNEYRMIRKDGTVRWVWDQAHGIYSPSGELLAVEGFITDITDRKRADQELREHGQRLQMLTERLVRVQEEEGRRIGRELHDDLGQILTMLKIRLQTVSLQEAGPPGKTRLADLTATVDQAIERVRTLSTELRPAVLDDLGLVAALRWMLDRQSRVAGFKGAFAVYGVENRLPPELEATCYRVAQEAVTNVVRHARAKHVRIDLQRIDNTIRLQVSDDGVGFDVAEALLGTSMGKSLGLVGMRERVELMKGLFSIRSSRKTGTIVQASFESPCAEHTPREL